MPMSAEQMLLMQHGQVVDGSFWAVPAGICAARAAHGRAGVGERRIVKRVSVRVQTSISSMGAWVLWWCAILVWRSLLAQTNGSEDWRAWAAAAWTRPSNR